MSASIWNPGAVTDLSVVNADNSYLNERIIATAGQTLVSLTKFNYTLGTNSLDVRINGIAQAVTYDYTETDLAHITLIEPVEAGDVIDVRGLVGSSAAQTATVSAGQAAASALTATSAANSILTANNTNTCTGNTALVMTLGAKVLTVPQNKQFIPGQYVIVADQADVTRWVSGQINTYANGSMTITVGKVSGIGTINNWNLSVSGIPEVQPDLFANVNLYAQLVATATSL